MFFHANTIKKGPKMPNYDVHAKHHFFMLATLRRMSLRLVVVVMCIFTWVEVI